MDDGALRTPEPLREGDESLPLNVMMLVVVLLLLLLEAAALLAG